MSHFTKIDKDGIVQQVIVANDRGVLSGDSSAWVETSEYNLFRKQYAGIGYTYDKANDVFIVPKPWPSWTLDANFDWQPPTAMPDDGKTYDWNEVTQAWDIVVEAAGTVPPGPEGRLP